MLLGWRVCTAVWDLGCRNDRGRMCALDPCYEEVEGLVATTDRRSIIGIRRCICGRTEFVVYTFIDVLPVKVASSLR